MGCCSSATPSGDRSTFAVSLILTQTPIRPAVSKKAQAGNTMRRGNVCQRTAMPMKSAMALKAIPPSTANVADKGMDSQSSFVLLATTFMVRMAIEFMKQDAVKRGRTFSHWSILLKIWVRSDILYVFLSVNRRPSASAFSMVKVHAPLGSLPRTFSGHSINRFQGDWQSSSMSRLSHWLGWVSR